MAINKNKVQLQETVLDSNGHPLSSTDVNPLTSSDCVIMENGMTLEDVMGNDTVIDTPTIMNEDTSFKVGIGDSETKVIDSDVAKMVIEGKTYQNILPKPTTLIMNTDEKEFKINDKIDNSIVLDDNIAEIATVKGQTYVNVVQEESATEYTVLGEDLSGQSITTTGKPEGVIKNATLEGMTLVNTIQEPSEANSVVLDLDADINAQSVTIDNTVQGGIKSAILSGNTLVNIPTTYNRNPLIGNIMVETTNLTMLKSNTKYLLKIINKSNYDITYYPNATSFTGNDFTVNGKSQGYVILTSLDTTLTHNGIVRLRSSSETITDLECAILFIEYQDGMENWDIPYFEGMQSVKMPVLTTTGKNLLDTTSMWFNGYASNSSVIKQSNLTKSLIVKVKPNTTYTFTRTQLTNRCVISSFRGNLEDLPTTKSLHDARGSYVENPVQFTTLDDTEYVIIYVHHESTSPNGWVEHGIYQLEEGSTATTYEPYQSNILTVNEEVELRGIGEIQDTLDCMTGELTERIIKIPLNSDNFTISRNTSLDTTNTLRWSFIFKDEALANLISQKTEGKCNVFNYVKLGAGDYEMIFIHPISTPTRLQFKQLITDTRFTTVSEFDSYLRKNNAVILLELTTPTIKTVDLTVTDQDGNTIPHIQAQPTLTHITTSSNGLIPFVTIPSQLKYPTIIKPSTTYTVQLKHTTVNNDNPLTINLGGTVMAVPSTKFTITTPETLTSQDVIFTGKNNVIGEVVITEGDTTNIEYDYFEGMNDVKFRKYIGDMMNIALDLSTLPQNNSISANYSVNGNTVYNSTGNDDKAWDLSATCYNNLKPNTRYIFFVKNIGNNPMTVARGHTRLNLGPGTGYGIQDLQPNTKSYFTYTTSSDCAGGLILKFTGSGAVRAEIYCSEYVEGMEQLLDECYFSYENTKLMVVTGENYHEPIIVEQDIDSIPLTSDMFEQGYYDYDKIIKGMSMQQTPLGTDDYGINRRIYSKSLIKVKPNSKYKVVGGLYGWFLFFDKNGNNIVKRVGSLVGVITNEFTTDSNTYYVGLVLHKENNGVTITPSDIPSDLTLQEVPQEIVLRGIGDVKDELDLTRGEYIQRIGEIVFDGSETWSHDAGNGSTDFSVFVNFNPWTNGTGRIISEKFPTVNVTYIGITMECIKIANGDLYVAINKDKLSSVDADGFKNYLARNPLTIQYVLATPIIKKVNLTNTTKLPSYNSITHYDTIVPSNSLIPNIKLPSTIDYNVAIKPSTQYTVRCNTTDALSVNLGGSVGTLANGKVTLTTPSTLTHNSLKLGSSGKVKELMVVEGSEIKDNVPFFNGMKNVQMGGIKLVNIARGATCNNLVTANTNKTQFTYTGDGTGWGYIKFDRALLKPSTEYTIILNIVKNESNVNPSVKVILGNATNDYMDIHDVGLKKIKYISPSKDNFDISYPEMFSIGLRPCSSGGQIIIQNPMIIEGDWTHLDEIPYIESEMIIEQPIIRSQGKNLFDIEESITSWNGATIKSNSDNTVTFTPNSDNSAGVNGTFKFVKPIRFKVGTQFTYTFNRVSGGNSDFQGAINARLRVNKKDGSQETLFIGDLTSSYFDKVISTTYTFTEDFDSIVSIEPIMYSVRNLTSPITIRYQLEEGSTATSYEPFKHQTLYSNRVIGYEDGCYYAWNTGTKTSAESIASVMSDVEGLNVAYVTHASSNFSFYDKDGVYLSGSMFLSTAADSNSYNSNFDRFGFIKIPANAKYMKMACGNQNSNTAKDYHLKATVTGELPLRSLPNGVCDTLNLVTGEYVQRVGEVVLDGSESWREFVIEPSGLGRMLLDLEWKSFITNKVPFVDYSGSWHNTYECISQVNGYKAIILYLSDVSKSEEFISKLKQNPVTVQYELATPIVRKIGLTAKGVFTEADIIPNHYQYESVSDRHIRATTSGVITPYPDAIENSPIFSQKYHVRHYPTDSHGDYQYIALISSGVYINIPKNEVSALTTNGCREWLSQHPIKVGYISTTQSSTTYSNILKPIFFNNVNVQFMNNNVDIQPSLTLQSRSRNSYVMDMMKANTTYTLKALANPNSFTIDGTSYSAGTNDAFTSPSTLTNKLLITGQDVQEFMIIEGDVTGKTIPYYKGIRSAYDNINEIEIYSVSKNLFDINNLVRTNPSLHTIVTGNSITFNCESSFLRCGECWIPTEIGKKYTISLGQIVGSVGVEGARIEVRFYNSLPTPLESENLPTVVGNTVTTRGKTTITAQAKYMRVTISNGSGDVDNEVTITDIQVEKSSSATSYIQHAHNTTIINMPRQLETVEVVRPVLEIGGIENNGQNSSTYLNGVRTRDLIPVKPNMLVSISNNGVNQMANWWLYDIDKNCIKKIQHDNSFDSSTLTIPENTYFIRIHRAQSDIDNLIFTLKQYKPIALNSLPNGVKDELIINRATSSAKLIRRVGKVVLDGSETWTQSAMWSSKYGVFFTRREDAKNNACLVLDRYKIIEDSENGLGKEIGYYSANDNYYLGIMLSIPCNTLDELRTMLKDNPLVAYYELAEPIITEIRLKGYPFIYEDGSITLNTDIAPVTRTSYNVNQHQLINSQNETIIRHDKQISDLYDYIEIYLDEIYRMELFRMQLELSL